MEMIQAFEQLSHGKLADFEKKVKQIFRGKLEEKSEKVVVL